MVSFVSDAIVSSWIYLNITKLLVVTGALQISSFIFPCSFSVWLPTTAKSGGTTVVQTHKFTLTSSFSHRHKASRRVEDSRPQELQHTSSSIKILQLLKQSMLIIDIDSLVPRLSNPMSTSDVCETKPCDDINNKKSTCLWHPQNKKRKKRKKKGKMQVHPISAQKTNKQTRQKNINLF